MRKQFALNSSRAAKSVFLCSALALSGIAAAAPQDDLESLIEKKESEPKPAAASKSSADFQKGLTNQIRSLGESVSSVGGGIVSKAMSAVGTPYVYGGTNIYSGVDCSGLVMSVFKKVAGVNLPRTAAEQAKATRRIDRADLRPGDLVFFNTIRSNSHVGVYVGDGKFVHSPRTGKSVRVDSMGNSYWNQRFASARRVG